MIFITPPFNERKIITDLDAVKKNAHLHNTHQHYNLYIPGVCKKKPWKKTQKRKRKRRKKEMKTDHNR
ncbi:hypothetical protein DERF_008603 [Dermatophagoides farinae]|uniref:Uncharacterized protein n=1 Tax=Dermatophagoides farinae TaxID=6954 RepID=A0A922I1A6_DERFA|nr:hypothetical protein DERF_008603 [Dermatophagoides farinae]